jgi:hypothetical protein
MPKPFRLLSLRGHPTLVTPVHYEGRGIAMLLRSYFLHYRAIRKIVTAAVIIGTAVLFSYWILEARF